MDFGFKARPHLGPQVVQIFQSFLKNYDIFIYYTSLRYSNFRGDLDKIIAIHSAVLDYIFI